MPFDLSSLLFSLFAAAISLQLACWLFFVTGIIKLKTLPPVAEAALPGISIIVAARNERANLQALIPALMAQEHPDFEVILVNDRSSDGSETLLAAAEKQYPNLRALHIHELPPHISGKKYALTLGIKAARHRQVLLTDADCRPASTAWAAHMASGFARGADIVLGFSAYRPQPGWLNYFIRFETLLTAIEYLGAAANKLPYMGVGRNLAYKKDLFLENKGFSGYQELIGGDDDLFVNKHATARNTVVVTGSDALTLSTAKSSWKTFWQQKIRHLAAGRQYSFTTKLSLGLFNLSWIFTWLLAAACLSARIMPEWVLYSLLLRQLILQAGFSLATKKLGVTFARAGIIFADLFYVIYYIFAGTRAITGKTKTWA